MADALSLSELARQLGRAKSGLHKLAAKGQIPKRHDGKFDLDEVKAALAANVDSDRTPAAVRPVLQPENSERAPVNTAIAAQASAEAMLATTRVREILAAEGVQVGEQALTLNEARTAETIVKVWQRDLLHAEAQGRLIDAAAAERRWADEIVKLRARLLAIPGDCALELSHLTKHEVSVIDRIVRDAMAAAADGDAA